MTVVVATLVATAVAHDWGWGNCPVPKAFSNLDVDKVSV